MARKAYIGTLTIDIVFTADEDIDDINSVAADSMRKAIEDMTSPCAGDVDCEVATYLPGDWTGDCYCYGSHEGDMKVSQALAQTPEYQQAISKLSKLAKVAKQSSKDESDLV